jgi:hypothetical protein
MADAIVWFTQYHAIPTLSPCCFAYISGMAGQRHGICESTWSQLQITVTFVSLILTLLTSNIRSNHHAVWCSKVLQFKPFKCTHVTILISLELLYMFRNMTVPQQEVCCRIQALWYNVMWCYGELSVCITYITHIYMYTPDIYIYIWLPFN